MRLHRPVKKILLISPHKVSYRGYKEDLTPVLGLAYIAAVLEQQGFEVKILDIAAENFFHVEEIEREIIRIGISYEEIEKRIRSFAPDVVGASCLISNQSEEMARLCRLTKSIDRDIITIVGGEHPSALPEDTLRNESIDFVVIGEGEYTTRDLLHHIVNGTDYSSLDGFAYRNDDRIVVNPKTTFIENLDELPLPARHLLPMKTYFKINLPQTGTSWRSPNTSMMTSRGCSARCIFCATSKFWGNRHRVRSVDKVLDEMEMLVKIYGVKELQFIDDNLTLEKDRAMRIFQGMIDRKLDLVWNTPQGIALWSIDEEVLNKMKESGCYEITFAVESGDDRVLKDIIRKPVRLETIEPLVKIAKKLGFITKGYFVVGLPGETLQNMEKTFVFARALSFDAAGIFIATPLPGTELYRLCTEKGYLKKDFSFLRATYARGNIDTPDFTSDQVEKLVSKNMLEINIGLLIRDPHKFLKKYTKILTGNPRLLVNHVLFLIRGLWRKSR
ncbi:MAG: radical SAM protein [Vulcanimicrobiota bacterium]